MRPRFALVVGAARSGTTLVRALLDAHPQVACPAEAGLPALMGQLAQTWRVIHADELESQAQLTAGDTPNASTLSQSVPPDARRWILETIARPIDHYCRSDEQVYCDKSLESIGHLPIVHELMPDTRVIMVYRHVMDTIASGLEASPWGFNSYGYEPFVQKTPSNFVEALARYWMDQVSPAIAWEAAHVATCCRVRYEDLVRDPKATLGAMQDFLGVTPDLAALTSAFGREAHAGPGDYKLDKTSSVHAQSVGRGQQVPVVLIPPALCSMVNQRLVALGYPRLTSEWNAGEKVWGR
jgi:protein-tyrosine sulfotransferase